MSRTGVPAAQYRDRGVRRVVPLLARPAGVASATAFVWLWIVVETINGIGHPVWSAWQRAYTPGVLTAPFLLVLALSLAFQMLRVSREER